LFAILERVAFLFERYRELVNPLGIQVVGEKKKKARGKLLPS